MSDAALMMQWVYIAKPPSNDEKAKMICTLCCKNAKGEWKTYSDNPGHGNLKIHLTHHETWKSIIATEEHKKLHRDACAEIQAGLDAKRAREGTGELPAPKKGPLQTNIDSKWTKRPEPCSDELLARMFCTAPIPFRFLKAGSEFRQCFNTNMDGGGRGPA